MHTTECMYIWYERYEGTNVNRWERGLKASLRGCPRQASVSVPRSVSLSMQKICPPHLGKCTESFLCLR